MPEMPAGELLELRAEVLRLVLREIRAASGETDGGSNAMTTAEWLEENLKYAAFDLVMAERKVVKLSKRVAEIAAELKRWKAKSGNSAAENRGVGRHGPRKVRGVGDRYY